MLFHVSISADRPAHVAEVLAELWGGKALPFPPVAVGSWIAFAGDDRGTAVEVYPRGTELHEADDEGDAIGLSGDAHHHNATHVAIATGRPVADVLAIARREGWPAKVCDRGGMFEVVEVWIEGTQMIELLVPEMQRAYRESMTIETWERMLEALRPLAA